MADPRVTGDLNAGHPRLSELYSQRPELNEDLLVGCRSRPKGLEDPLDFLE